MRRFLLVAFSLTVASVVGAQATLLREFKNGRLISPADPAVSLVVDSAFTYVGGQSIDIAKVAGAEQHFFIDADANKTIRRFYWLQFEQYYPSNNYTYNYAGIKGAAPVTLATLAGTGDVRVVDNYFTTDQRPGSDSKAAEDFLRARGYNLAGRFAVLRVFHLPDASRRKELMIIYGEAAGESATADQVRAEIITHAQRGIKLP